MAVNTVDNMIGAVRAPIWLNKFTNPAVVPRSSGGAAWIMIAFVRGLYMKAPIPNRGAVIYNISGLLVLANTNKAGENKNITIAAK